MKKQKIEQIKTLLSGKDSGRLTREQLEFLELYGIKVRPDYLFGFGVMYPDQYKEYSEKVEAICLPDTLQLIIVQVVPSPNESTE